MHLRSLERGNLNLATVTAFTEGNYGLEGPGNGNSALNSVSSVLIFLDHAAAAAKSLQSCPTLCGPIDGSPPGSPAPGILYQPSTVGHLARQQPRGGESDTYVSNSSQLR